MTYFSAIDRKKLDKSYGGLISRHTVQGGNIIPSRYQWVGEDDFSSGIGLVNGINSKKGLLGTFGGTQTIFVSAVDGTYQFGPSGKNVKYDGTNLTITGSNLVLSSGNHVWVGTPVTDGVGFTDAGLYAATGGDQTLIVDQATGGFTFGKLSGNNLTYDPTTSIISINGVTFADWGDVNGNNLPAQNADATPPLPSDENLEGYWSLDDGSGTTVRDSSGNGNDGTTSGSPAWDTSAVVGKCLSFDGTNYFYIPDDTTLNFGTDDFTITVWFNVSATGNYSNLIYKGALSGLSGWRFGLYPSGSPGMLIGDTTGYTAWSFGSTNYADNNWHFLAISYDRSSNATCYVDGELIGTHNISAISGSVDNTSSIVIANTYDNYSGKLDEIRMYRQVLTASEIKALYLNPSGMKAPIPGADVTADSNFVTVTYPADQSSLQTQIDGKIISWFQSTDPSSSWSGSDASHAGDMWWNTSTNKLKRYDGSAWSADLTDQKAIDAYANAATAQDTADHKRRVFTTTPTAPYDVGDLWDRGTSLGIWRCNTAQASGGSYSISHWQRASDITANVHQTFRVVSRGNSSTTHPRTSALLDESGTVLKTGGRSYNVSIFDRSTKQWDSHTTYDVYATSDTESSLYSSEVSGTGTTAIASQTFTAVDCTGLTKANGTLIIDLKCSDFTKLSGSTQIEVSSSTSSNTNEWCKSFSDLSITTAWKTFNLPLSEFATTGGEVDVTDIKRIRVYGYFSESETIYWRNAEIHFGDTDGARAMADALFALDSSKIVAIFSNDEPQTNRLSSNLDTQIYRCGGSKTIYGSSNFKYRGAYCLIGITDIGQGNGLELYSGDISSDPDAWVDTTFTIDNLGNINLSNVNVRDAVDISYQDGTVVEDLKPAAAGADVTADSPQSPDWLTELIGTLHIADSSITAAKTAVAAIDPSTGNIAANHIVANMIQADTITGDKIYGSTLAAINADLGHVTAGSIDAGLITSGTLSVGFTEAKCTDPNADQTSQKTAKNTYYANDTTNESGNYLNMWGDIRVWNGNDIAFYSSTSTSSYEGGVYADSNSLAVYADSLLALIGDVITFQGSYVYPIYNKSQSLGKSSNQWQYTYTEYLGSSSYPVSTVYADNIGAYNYKSNYVYTDSLGHSSYRTGKIYGNHLDIDNGGNVTIGSSSHVFVLWIDDSAWDTSGNYKGYQAYIS